MAVGYAARKLHLMNDRLDEGLSRIVLDITLPCLIVGSVLTSENLPSSGTVGTIFLVSCAAYAVIMLIALIAPYVMRLPRGERGAYSFMTAFGNVGFIGIPVCSAVFGPDAVLYVAILNIPFNLLIFTVGILLLTEGGKRLAGADGVQTGDHRAARRDQLRTGAKSLLSPTLLSCVLAMVLALAGVTCDNIVSDVITLLGQMTVPAAMLIIGSSLARMPIREMMGDWRAYAVSAFRLLVVPLSLLGLMTLAHVSGELLVGALVLTAGMPVATNGTLLAIKYGGDLDALARGTFVSTVLTFATLPFLVWLVLL